MTVRIGVLGTASIAWRRTLPAFAEVPGLELAAVASRERASAERFTERFGGTPVEGYRQLLERPDVDAVYVPLPTGLHHEWVARALRAGKHVLAEKPLTGSAGHTRELVALARERGLLLRENLMFTHHHRHERVRRLVADGAIGELRSLTAVFGIPPLPATDVRYRPELGGGALLDVGVYPVRAARLLLGDDLRVLGAHLRTAAPDGVDVAGAALLGTPDGVTAQLAFGFEHHYRNAYELWGSTGRMVVDRAFTPPADQEVDIRIERPDGVETVRLAADHQFRNTAAAFVHDLAAAGGPLRPAAWDASDRDLLRQADLVDAVRVAAQD
ncbi:Gfo/Idh/MocA family protein [Kitasatospora sp. NPDC056446]|uniref:Gfo/Idh/MocA family protein n=1 Tax=Kitasatospora sp. NPDC056446 TaxID=3345819 RepID=UPI0036A9EFF7